MTLPVTDVSLEVFKPSNDTSTPDLTIRNDDDNPSILSIKIKREIQRDSGSATIAIDNYDGTYAGEITAGDRLEIEIVGGGSGGDNTFYGDGFYGDGFYGGTFGNRHNWTGMAQTPRYRFDGLGKRSITIGAQPFVFAVLGSLGRKVDNAFRGRTADHILTTILDDEASEIDQSEIDSFPNSAIDIEFDGTPLHKAVAAVANEVDAVVSGIGTTIDVTHKDDIPIQWTATATDFNTWAVDNTDDELWNQIRVEGGTDNDLGDEQTTQTNYTTITEGSPATQQINITKSRIDEAELWTNTLGNEETLTLAIQEDISGSPTNSTDSTKDLVNKSLSHEFLSDDDFTTFLLSHTELPDETVWLIARSDGENGINIGTDGSGNLAYRAYYPFPIITEKSRSGSIDEYRRREHRVERDNITTSTAAAQVADRLLNHHEDPRSEFSTGAESYRAHNINPGAAIELDFPYETAEGKFLVSSRVDRFGTQDKNVLKTDLRLEEAESF